MARGVNKVILVGNLGKRSGDEIHRQWCGNREYYRGNIRQLE